MIYNIKNQVGKCIQVLHCSYIKIDIIYKMYGFNCSCTILSFLEGENETWHFVKMFGRNHWWTSIKLKWKK
jgi:hypothetical protein